MTTETRSTYYISEYYTPICVHACTPADQQRLQFIWRPHNIHVTAIDRSIHPIICMHGSIGSWWRRRTHAYIWKWNEMGKKLHDAAHENVTAYVYVGAKLCAASSQRPNPWFQPSRAWIPMRLRTNGCNPSDFLSHTNRTNRQQRSHEYFCNIYSSLPLYFHVPTYVCLT